MCKHLYIALGMVLFSNVVYTMDDWEQVSNDPAALMREIVRDADKKKWEEDWAIYNKNGEEEPSTPPLTTATVVVAAASALSTHEDTPLSATAGASSIPSSPVRTSSIFKLDADASTGSPLLAGVAAIARSASGSALHQATGGGAGIVHKRYPVSSYFTREQSDPRLAIPMQRLDDATQNNQNIEGDMDTSDPVLFVVDFYMFLLTPFISSGDSNNGSSGN